MTTELVTLTIDDQEVSVPPGTLVIRAAEQAGVYIPRFCDHPKLDPAGACRQCMVEVPDAGNGRGFPKPQSACTLVAMPGMVVKTQATSQLADRSQKGVMELLLINHPLDCPTCDKGGECPLQNQALEVGRTQTRYDFPKRDFKTPVDLVSNILLDRERCIMCTRCLRFDDEISGDLAISKVKRGAKSQIFADQESDRGSYFMGNTVQICPVGALTSADYRFQARPFDLVSTDTTCEHCAGGCALRVDHRASRITRRLAGEDEAVNGEWNCDKGRYGFRYIASEQRLTQPLIRTADGLQPTTWAIALRAAAEGLARATRTGVITGGSATVENTAAFADFARTVLRTANLDFRNDLGTAEEAEFLRAHVAGSRADAGAVTLNDFSQASAVVTVGLDPEDEAAISYLRLRHAHRKHGLRIIVVGSHLSLGANKLDAELVAAVPGQEAAALSSVEGLDENSIILLGSRAATSRGIYAAAQATGARVAWVPLNAGDRGAVEVDALPGQGGLGTADMLRAARDGALDALVVGALDPRQFADAPLLLNAVDKAFTVALAVQEGPVTERADVIFPVAVAAEVRGHFMNWESRWRPVTPLTGVPVTQKSHRAVLSALARQLGSELQLPPRAEIRVAADKSAATRGTEVASANASATKEVNASANASATGVTNASASAPATGETNASAGSTAFRATAAADSDASGSLVLDTWAELMGSSPALDHTLFVGSDRRRGRAYVSPATAAQADLRDGDLAAISGPAGTVALPVHVDDSVVDGVVWAPSNVPSHPLTATGAVRGSTIALAKKEVSSHE